MSRMPQLAACAEKDFSNKKTSAKKQRKRELTLMSAPVAADWNALLLMSRGSEAAPLSVPLAKLDMRGRCLEGVREVRPT